MNRPLTDVGAAVLTALTDGGAWTARTIATRMGRLDGRGRVPAGFSKLLSTQEGAGRVNAWPCWVRDTERFRWSLTLTGRVALRTWEEKNDTAEEAER